MINAVNSSSSVSFSVCIPLLINCTGNLVKGDFGGVQLDGQPADLGGGGERRAGSMRLDGGERWELIRQRLI